MSQNNFIGRLQQAAKDDPKKAGILTILVVVLLVMMARQLMKSSGSSPVRSAVAASKNPARSATGNLGSRPIGAGSIEAMRKWQTASPRPISRNLFAVKLDFFPQDTSKISKTLRPPAGEGFWDDVAKSMIVQADQKMEKQILVENLQLRAAQLRLQTTIMGPQPKALIDGELVGEGSVVAGFRVLRIEARRIIVEREGIKLEIQMK